MTLQNSDQLTNSITSIIHRETQLHEMHMDLTVGDIYNLISSGALDFGGSEFTPCQTKRIEPKKKNPEDDYGWWPLNQGTYLVRFNEKLDIQENKIAIIAPHTHTVQAGIILNTHLIARNNLDSGEITTTFQVPETGTAIKENARFASVILLE